MELSPLQIELFKSLTGMIITGTILVSIGYGIKIIVDKIPTNFIDKLF